MFKSDITLIIKIIESPTGAREFITAGRFQVSPTPDGLTIERFIYGHRYLERKYAVDLNFIELRLRRRKMVSGFDL